MAQFAVQLSKGDEITITEADTYQFEGPLTTFFSTGSGRQVIDSWSTRVASYRTADIVSIERTVATGDIASAEQAAETDQMVATEHAAATEPFDLDLRGLVAA